MLLTKVKKIKAKIDKLQDELKQLQASCDHNDAVRAYKATRQNWPAFVTKVHGSDTGNWDRSDDSYWTDCACTLCEARWTEDGSL